MKHSSLFYFHKNARKYRNLQARIKETRSQPLLRKLSRKLDLLRRRLLRLNRARKLGISTAVLLVWMAAPSQAQTPIDSLNLSDLDGSNGFVINGINLDDRSGYSVSGAGDLNGDGLDDLIIGARFASSNNNSGAGESYVVFGSNSFADSLNLSNLDGSNGFVIKGIDKDDGSGFSVSGAGDLNGDGLDDLIIGAIGGDPNGNMNAGESYVIFGNTSFEDSLNLSSLDGSNGFVINGMNELDLSGTSVSSAGDLNGDGLTDLIVGARFADPNMNSRAGESYVIFGNPIFVGSLELSDLNGSNGFVINGIAAEDNSGFSVSEAGDLNGDGLADLIIGAWRASPNGKVRAGESYVIFGDSSFAATLNLSDLDGNNGFVISGIDAGDYLGYSVSGVGDLNGDGLADLIIGAIFASPNDNFQAGKSYVAFGDSSFSASLDLQALNGSNGFVINGIDAGDQLGVSVSGAGDLNGDGLGDLIIGANGVNSFAGESYVVYGRHGFNDSLNLSDLDGSNGYVISGIDEGDGSGVSVSGAGDVNGDGLDDLILGAHYGDPNGNSNAGESYVVFGRSMPTSITEQFDALPLEVAPNPTADRVSLRSEHFAQSAEVEIHLFDLLGRSVLTPCMRIGRDRFEMDLRTLPGGTYFLRVEARGRIGTSKLIKQ